jgi:outer membrane protein assembly factor BamE
MRLFSFFHVIHGQPRMPFRVLLAAPLALLLAACSSFDLPVPHLVTEYKIDVQQGNVLSQEMVARLRPGLSREQVRFILGTPVLEDVFHSARWDYVFYLTEGRTGKVTRRALYVYFDEEGYLERLGGDAVAGTPEELNAPVAPTQVVDLGTVDPNAKPLPPAEQEKSWWGRFTDFFSW